MNIELLHRPTRSIFPVTKPDPEMLAPAPPVVDEQTGPPIQMLLPVMGALTSVVMMVVLRGGNPLFLMVAAMMFVVAVVGGVGFALSSRGKNARKARFQRELYLDYLERTRADLRQRAVDTRIEANTVNPAPAGLTEIVRDRQRLWERRRGDADFAAARVGVGTLPWFGLTVPDVESPIEPADPIVSREADIVVRTHDAIEDMPITANLRQAGVVAIIGDRAATMNQARALLAQLAVHHSPDDVAMAAAFGDDRADEWAGFDLLPHVQDVHVFDGPVPARRIAPDVRSLAGVLSDLLSERLNSATAARRRGIAPSGLARLVVVLDEHGQNATALPIPDSGFSMQDLAITVIHLVDDRMNEPADVDVRIEIGDTATLTHNASNPESTSVVYTPDSLTPNGLTALARSMAALRVSRLVRDHEVEEVEAFDVTDLLGLTAADNIDVDKMWAERSPTDFLRVPFAVDDGGQPVYLDLKESAQLGMGPHGICVGATGSGKSEMLRTLILSLALGHSPEDLSMILVDYKGGAAFAPFAPLPHLAGLIDNLEEDPQLTARARASLEGEVVRRQQILKAADSSPSITHYREMRRKNPDLPPLPHLFVVIDEFGELLTAEPDFVDLFLQIGRIGRSIGVHLLLSSQRIESGKLKGLDTYLSYRLGLRTFSESESQVVLSTKDAFNLPALPGYGYLKVDTSVYQRFRAGYVSGRISAPRPSRTISDDNTGPKVFELPRFNGIDTGSERGAHEASAPKLSRPDTGQMLVDAAVGQLRDDDRAVAPVWLKPLPERLALGHILDREKQNPRPVAPVIGIEDKPAKQAQDPWILDLNRSGGHVWIVGAPGSGRTTLLRTIATSLALTYSPREVSVYGMDLTGGGLRRLEAFPHVGGVATRSDPGRLRRLLEELAGMVAHREKLFKDFGIDSMTQLRTMHADGELPGLSAADVVLLVDGYGALRQDFMELEDAFVNILQRAASFGIHIVLAMTRSSELRMAQQSLFGTRIELHLNDPGDSNIDRKLAQTVSEDTPGRALTDAKTMAHVALPLLDVVEPDHVAKELESLAERTAEAWGGKFAAPIRLLPTDLDPGQLPDPVDEPDSVPFGLRQDSMSTAHWDLLGEDQHLIILGDSKSGKSTTLRVLATELIERFAPSELAIAVVDPRGHVPGVIPDEYLAAHAKTLGQAQGLAQSIASELDQRPGRSRKEKDKTPRVVLLVDDFDIVAAGGTEPLAAILPHLPAARDLEFHVVLTRPVAGATRALYGATLQMLRDTGGATMMLSGDRAEGQILPRVYPETFPPGRARYVRRGVPPFVVQVANLTKSEDE